MHNRVQHCSAYWPSLMLLVFVFMLWGRTANATPIVIVNPQDLAPQPLLEEEDVRIEKIGDFRVEWEFLGTRVRFFNGVEWTEFTEDAPIHSASLDFCNNDEDCMIAVATRLGTKLHLFKLEDISHEYGVSLIPFPIGRGLIDFVRVSRGIVFCGRGYVYDQTRNQFAYVPIKGNWIEAYNDNDNGFLIVAFDPFPQGRQRPREDYTLQLAVFDPQHLRWVSDPLQIDYNYQPRPIKIVKPKIVARRMVVQQPFIFLYETKYRGPDEPAREVAVEVLDSRTLKKLWVEKVNSQIFVHPEGKYATFVGRNNEAVVLVNMSTGKIVRELLLPADVRGYFIEPISYDGQVTTIAVSVQQSRSLVASYFYAWNLEGVEIEAEPVEKNWLKKKWSKLGKIRVQDLRFKSKT